MSRARRLVAAAAGVLAAALVLSGCATPVDPAWRPPAWAAGPAITEEPPAPLDPSAVPHLNGQRIRNDGVGVQARWSLLPGTHPINARLAAIVKDAATAGAKAAHTTYRPAVFPAGAGLGDRGCVRGSTLRPAVALFADPAVGPPNGQGTTVVCDVVAAAGAFFGERVRVLSGDAGGARSDVTTVLYANVATGEVMSADQLWTPTAPTELWDDVVDALRRHAGSLSLTAIAPPDATGDAAMRTALATAVPAPDGTLVLTLPAGFTAPELAALGVPPTTAPTSVGLPPPTTTPMLTPFGASLAASAGEPFAAPAVVPAGREPVDCGLVPCVALTYDDGPSDLTPGILDAAAAHHASVTFFAMGEKAAPYADTLKRALAEGHLVENHTWNHPHLTTLSSAKATAQIRDTQKALTDATGVTPTVFRPPYGQYNAGMLSAAGMPAILWDVDTFDWQGTADDVLTRRAVDGPAPGSIVLQHDIQANTARTAAAVYDGLLDRGFSLVNVQQLFGGALPTSGAYRSAR